MTDCYQAVLKASHSMSRGCRKSGQLTVRFEPNDSLTCKGKAGFLLYAICVEFWLVASIESIWEARQRQRIIERLATCNVHVTHM